MTAVPESGRCCYVCGDPQHVYGPECRSWKPPKNAHRVYALEYDTAPWGQCRLCGGPILRPDGEINKQRRWHVLCSRYYDVVAHRHWTLRAFQRVDGTLRCYGCDFRSHAGECRYDATASTASWERRYGWMCVVGEHRTFDIDHRVALIDGGSLDFHNLQILCGPCHKAKTRREARERADRRRREIHRRAGVLPLLELPA